jgi:hypothetical protein
MARVTARARSTSELGKMRTELHETFSIFLKFDIIWPAAATGSELLDIHER